MIDNKRYKKCVIDFEYKTITLDDEKWPVDSYIINKPVVKDDGIYISQ